MYAEIQCMQFIFQAVAEMAAIGFGLQKDAFTSLMKQVIVILVIPATPTYGYAHAKSEIA